MTTATANLPTVNDAVQHALAFMAADNRVASVWIQFVSAISGPMTCKLLPNGDMLHVQPLVGEVDYEAYEV